MEPSSVLVVASFHLFFSYLFLSLLETIANVTIATVSHRTDATHSFIIDENEGDSADFDNTLRAHVWRTAFEFETRV